MADLTSLNVQMQKFLQDEGHYKNGALDGKMGPQTHKAILALMKEYKVPTKGWTKARALIALEQLFYKGQKIEVGGIDGKVGPQTLYAREVFSAKQATTWRDTADKIAEVVKPTPVVNVKVSAPVKVNWPRQSAVSSYFGTVGKNQVSCILPYEMVLAWDTKSKVRKFSCHKLVKEPLERIFKRTLDWYGYEEIKRLRLHYFGGCLNVRKVRGCSNYSMHAWGIAVDLDPDRNQLKWGKDKAVFAKPEYKKFWEFVYDEGAISLGIERNYDFMHLQFSKL